MRKIILYLLYAAHALEGKSLQESGVPAQWVSLGSHCEVAGYLRYNDLRTNAYPFDWLLTLDISTCLALLQDDFSHFMDERYLVQEQMGYVINTYYTIDFRHEDWGNSMEHIPAIREKYQRRIKRFSELRDFPGMVYFVRGAFDNTWNFINNLPTLTEGCSIITYDQARSLRDLLVEKFPDLDFHLIILNYQEETTQDILGLERVTEFKISKANKGESFKRALENFAK